MNKYYSQFNNMLNTQIAFVQVTLIEVQGSGPQHEGSKILVSSGGLEAGTIGGGALEAKAISQAQDFLKQKTAKLISWQLNSDLGMTCGGCVKLFFETFNTCCWEVAVFGAGHVGIALADVLKNLECHVTCIDTRENWLEKLPSANNIKAIKVDKYEDYVPQLPKNSYIVIMTPGHEYDKEVLISVLKSKDFPYIGVIGSKSKAIDIKKTLLNKDFSKEQVEKYYCPIGLPMGNNQPYEIAISIIAQLIQVRDAGDKGDKS